MCRMQNDDHSIYSFTLFFVLLYVFQYLLLFILNYCFIRNKKSSGILCDECSGCMNEDYDLVVSKSSGMTSFLFITFRFNIIS